MNWSLSDPCNLLLLLFISWCASSSSSFHGVHFGIVSNSSSHTFSSFFHGVHFRIVSNSSSITHSLLLPNALVCILKLFPCP